MSELTDQQRADLQQQLLAMRSALKARAQASTEETRPVSLDQPIGRLTRMDAIQQQQMALGQQHRVEQELQQVEAALQRLEQNRYGSCLRCRNDIPSERLTVRPITTLCFECQGELETRAHKR
jgi:DnaK suppressor protein